jgi:hypothetical protein
MPTEYINEYNARQPQREFMARIARDINKVDWMSIQVGDEQASIMVFTKEYKETIMSRLLTLTQEQSIRVLLAVIEANKIAPLFKDMPADNTMSEEAILRFDSCQFDF